MVRSMEDCFIDLTNKLVVYLFEPTTFILQYYFMRHSKFRPNYNLTREGIFKHRLSERSVCFGNPRPLDFIVHFK